MKRVRAMKVNGKKKLREKGKIDPKIRGLGNTTRNGTDPSGKADQQRDESLEDTASS